MNCKIGEIIFRLREEAGLSQGQLCHGLCSVPQMARMEQDQVTMDYFLLDRFFGCLGKSTERLEYVLTAEAYEIYELQFLIQKSISYQRLEEAEHLLQVYEDKKIANKALHIQYIWQMRAQIAWMQGKETGIVLDHLEHAMEQTIPSEKVSMKNTALSADEIRLLLFRWEVCMGTGEKRPVSELVDIVEYINDRKMVDVEKVKVYPYAALLLGKVWNWEEHMDLLMVYTKEALSILQNTGKILYMPEILAQYADLLECRNEKDQRIEQFRTEGAALLAVERTYGIRLEKFRLFQHLNRRFELDYELIRRTRAAKRIPQEKLCENICTQEELSRIESGKRKPRDKNFYQLMEQMDRKRRRVETILMTEDYDVLELKREYFLRILRFEIDDARKLLNEIEERLDPTIPENQQFLLGEKIKIKSINQELDFQQCIDQLQNILSMTLDIQDKNMGEVCFTAEEHCILNEMAANYSEKGDKENAINIWRLQIENMEKSSVVPIFHILEWDLSKGNLAIAYEETGRLSEAVETSKEKIRMSLEAGKGNGIGRSLITIASALEQEKDETCADFFCDGMELLRLYKMEYRYRLVDTFINSSDFLFKERFNHYHAQHRCLSRQSV